MLKFTPSVSESIESDAKSRAPQQRPGQDLEKMAIAFCGEALELAKAGQCERNLTLAMLKSCLLAGGTDNGDFQCSLRGVKSKLKDELLATGCADKARGEGQVTLQGHQLLCCQGLWQAARSQ